MLSRSGRKCRRLKTKTQTNKDERHHHGNYEEPYVKKKRQSNFKSRKEAVNFGDFSKNGLMNRRENKVSEIKLSFPKEMAAVGDLPAVFCSSC